MLTRYLLSSFLILIPAGLRAADQTYVGKSKSSPINLQRSNIQVEFSFDLKDTNGDKVLDANEKMKIIGELTNLGPGTARGIEILGKITTQTESIRGHLDTSDIEIETNGKIRFVMDIQSDHRLNDGSVEVLFSATNAYGLDKSRPLHISTRALVPPDLATSSFQVDDDNEGQSSGNNNHRIDLGEVVEIHGQIANTGQGQAYDVRATLMSHSDNITYLGREYFQLGDLPPGEDRLFTFYFAVPRNLDPSSPIQFRWKIAEATGLYGCDFPVDLKINASSNSAQRKTVSRPDLIVNTNVPVYAEKNPGAVAVIIGNHAYQDPRIGEVRFAEEDASVVRDYLENLFGVEQNRIIYEIDATYSKMREIFGSPSDYRGRLFTMVDTTMTDLFVYYSGHGAPNPDTSLGYLVPTDCGKDATRLNGYSLDLLLNNLNKLNARRLTVVIDACFSGTSFGNTNFLENRRPLVKPVHIGRPSRPQDTYIFASRADESASEYPDGKHGLLTFVFLRAIRGEADTQNPDGVITVRELKQYLSNEVTGVPGIAGSLTFSQNPIVMGTPENVFVRIRK